MTPTPPETAPVEVTKADNDLADWFRRRMEGYTRSQIAPMLARHRTAPEAARQDGLREALRAAYLQGALDVHGHWLENPGEAPRGDPEFGEAASDYAAAALDPFDSSALAALSDISPLANDTGALREDREQGEIVITGLMEVLDDLLKGQDSAYWLLRERARWWLNGDKKPAALSPDDGEGK